MNWDNKNKWGNHYEKNQATSYDDDYRYAYNDVKFLFFAQEESECGQRR